MAEASAKGDIKGVERVLKDMRYVNKPTTWGEREKEEQEKYINYDNSDGHRAPANKARTAAEKIQDPRAKDRVLAALNDLDSLLPLQAQAAHDLAKAPKDPAKKALLDQGNQNIRVRLFGLNTHSDNSIATHWRRLRRARSRPRKRGGVGCLRLARTAAER